MKVTSLIVPALIATALLSNGAQGQQDYGTGIVCAPNNAVEVDANNAYIPLNTTLYKYSVPDLNLETSHSGDLVCGPGSINGQALSYANSDDNSNSITFSATDLSVTSKSNNPAPQSSPYYVEYGQGSVSSGADTYTYQTGFLVHTRNGNEVERLALGTTDNNAPFISFDADVENRIHLATDNSQGRGSSQWTYYAINTNPLSLVRAGEALPNTANSGCPVAPQGCGVPVLLDFKALNDVVTYAWSITQNSVFQVTAVTYDARCDVLRSVALGQSLAKAARCTAVVGNSGSGSTTAPTVAPTVAPAPVGQSPSSSPVTSAPAPVGQSTTKAPVTSAPAPVTTKAPTPVTTKTPTSTTSAPTTTTKAPSSTLPAGATAGDDQARSSGSTVASALGAAALGAIGAAAVL